MSWATGPARNWIEFSEADLEVFGGSPSKSVQYFLQSQDHGIETCIVRPMACAEGNHGLATLYARSRCTDSLAWSFTMGPPDAAPAWQLADARTRGAGAAFAELRISLVAKLALADLTSSAKVTLFKYACDGDGIASLAGHESAAVHVARLRARFPEITPATPLVLVGFEVRPGGADFRRPTEEEIEACSDIEGDASDTE